MNQEKWLAETFEQHRPRLRAVAYRMLGSPTEAEDAVQDAWLRVSRAEADDVDNMGGWLTTIVSRVCLNMLRSRNVRREESLGVLPDPIVTQDTEPQPEDEAVLADSVGLALLVVLDTLSPAERLAFVLHDMFKLPFEEIAPMVDRSPEAARQLASRARRRVKGADVRTSEADLTRRRQAVDAFFQAARGGDLDSLLQLLDPEVVLRADYGDRRPSEVIRGAEAVAGQAFRGAIPKAVVTQVLVNGETGGLITVGGRPFALMAFTVSQGRITEIDAIADPERVARLAASVLPNG